MIKKLVFLSIYFFSMGALHAESAMIEKSVEYAVQKDKMEGYIAYDKNQTETRPAILIVHDWMGLGDFTKGKAVELAKEGYVAFAVDIYGKDIRPKNGDEAAKISSDFKNNRQKLRARIKAAYDVLAKMKEVNPKKIIVMGYCFGGTTALELARSGANLAGTVSFHGGLATPNPQDAKNIKAPLLVMHGADDPYVPAAEVAAFKKEMENAAVKMKFVSYAGAVHAFAVPGAGNDKSKGAAYNEQADKKSWVEFHNFLKEVL